MTITHLYPYIENGIIVYRRQGLIDRFLFSCPGELTLPELNGAIHDAIGAGSMTREEAEQVLYAEVVTMSGNGVAVSVVVRF